MKHRLGAETFYLAVHHQLCHCFTSDVGQADHGVRSLVTQQRMHHLQQGGLTSQRRTCRPSSVCVSVWEILKLPHLHLHWLITKWIFKTNFPSVMLCNKFDSMWCYLRIKDNTACSSWRKDLEAEKLPRRPLEYSLPY